GPAHVSRSPAGEAVISLDEETQERIGLETSSLPGMTRQPEVVAYGNLIEDPTASFTLRAPMTGILRTVPSRPWPSLGEVVADNSTVAEIEPRLTAVEQLDVSSKLAAAHAEMSSAAASLQAAQASYQSKKELHDQNKAVSDRAVEEAEAKVKTEEARLKAATETVRLTESSLGIQTAESAGKPLIVSRGGEIVEVLAGPDEAIESGQPVLRVARRDHLLARVELPAGEQVNDAVPAARIAVIGHEDWVLPGEPMGLAPTVSQRTQGQAYLFKVACNGSPIRPGMAVAAYMALPGDPLTGVIVPRSAIVRYAALAWAYLKTGEDQFTRRELHLLSPTEAGWFVTAGLSAGDTVVVTGAQVLLSQELKAQIEREEVAAE
ncbi:MAG TPA: efflux RND transporter periplasmic adaptor subunit, partial [Phycisphaerae bacterium]|nr:efflux RND transporter periplasmic adaptor subunit [Phycisphaerae bacterium]